MDNRKTIITVFTCIIALSCSFMWVYSKTLQRTADDLVKIRAADARNVCDQMNGNWTYSNDSINGSCVKK